MAQSIIKGFMLLHTDGDREYYEPDINEKEQERIYKILDKHGDNFDSKRGDLAVLDMDGEKLQQIADRIYNFLPPWDSCDTSPEEIKKETAKNPLDCILFLLDQLDA